MTIAVGEKIPATSLTVMGDKGPQPFSSADLFADKKVVVFAVPGAYTPTCSAAHVPGFVVNAPDIKAKGVDSIICVSVNDAFVMSAWGKVQNADDLIMAADGNGDFTEALGLTMDASAFGMGKRSQRYSMIVDNGVVSALHVDAGGAFEVSSAQKILEDLG